MSAIQKYSEVVKDFEFCDDFGDGPLLMGHFTTDRSLIAVVSLLGGFIAMAGLGIPGALLVAFAGLNDVSYAGKCDRDEDEAPPAPERTSVDGAIDVPAVTVEGGTNAIATAPSYGVSTNRNPVGILVAALFAHRAFYGGQRTGKSLLASAASAAIVQHAPGTKVFYVNLFAFDETETRAMFGHAHKSVIADLAPMTPSQATKPIDALLDLLSEFAQTTGAVLVLDEAASIGDKFGRHVEALSPVVNELVGYLSSIRDSSKKRRKAVWTIAPGIVAGNLTDGMKTLLKGFPPVLVAIPKGRSVDWMGQALTTDTTIAGQLKANYPSSGFDAPEMDTDRVVQIDGVWMPMPHLKIPDLIPTYSPAPSSSESTPMDEAWEVDEPIEAGAVEVRQSHPLNDKFDRLEALMNEKDSLPIREIQRAFSCKSDEAQQIAQMFCLKAKSTYRFSQSTKPNGTVSKSIERV